MRGESHRLVAVLVLILSIWSPPSANGQGAGQVHPFVRVQGAAGKGVVGLDDVKVGVDDADAQGNLVEELAEDKLGGPLPVA